MHNIAWVYRAQPDPAAFRRRNAAVDKLQFGSFNLALVEFNGTFQLLHQRLLGGILLLGNGILARQHPIPLQVHSGILQLGLVTHQLALGLG